MNGDIYVAMYIVGLQFRANSLYKIHLLAESNCFLTNLHAQK